MFDSHDKGTDMSIEDRTSRLETTVRILLLCESIALVIALIMPITPNKTGSNSSFADWFVAEPTYLQKVLVNFLFTNALIALLAIAFMLTNRGNKSTDGQKPPAE